MASVKPEPDDDSGFGIGHADPRPEEDESKVSVGYLQQLVSSTSPELLEKGVSIGMRVLDGIKAPLEAVAQLSTTQASQWLKSIGDLEALAKPTRTIVGVVGNTGAGKSSVISAVLDEERYTGPALA
jgi:hypothetical protein